jgi:hypothetical protein
MALDQRMRALVALVVLAAIAAILWLFYNAQAHPLGSLGYDYLNSFPGFLVGLAIVGGLVVLRMALGSRKNSKNGRTTPGPTGPDRIQG